MADIGQLTSQINICLQHFNRSEYAIEFDNYRRSTEHFFAELKADDIDDTVEKLIGMADGLTKRRFGSKTRLFDFRAFLCVYVCPAAMSANDTARAFAESLIKEWNSRYPKFSFQSAGFEEIQGGFRSRPFGL